MDDIAKKKDKEKVYDIILNAYDEGDLSKSPTQSTIGEMIREIKNSESKRRAKEEGIECVHLENCQSSASKCLKALINEKRILKKTHNNKTVYIPYTVDEARGDIKKRIIDKVVFNQETVFLFASGKESRIKKTGEKYVYATCSLLVDVSFDYIVTAKELFRKYIGTENCYDILEFQGKVLIMIEGVKEEVAKLRRNIREIVEETYDKNTKGRK